MAPSSERRLPLNRDRIMRAALQLGDESGIESLSMRRLSDVLGFGVMSLYNHVANKDDVLNGMLDLVLAETQPPAAEGEWDAAIRESAISVHDAMRRHPWSTTLLMAIGHFRPARAHYMELLLQRLRGAGFSAEATYHAYHVLDGYIFGFSLWETSHTYSPEQVATLTAAFSQIITAEAFPSLHEHAQQHFDEGPQHELHAFELGLDLIVEGLKKVHTTPWQPAPKL